VTPAALALAWVLDRGAHLIPIPGTRTAEHLRAWAMAPEIDLTDDDREEIDRLLPVGWAWGDRYDDLQAATVERYS
jgi:aryl-alcohol dehydrogenase-like predicted oxidoreductase